MTRIKHPVIGITLGDPSGIGAEVTAKSLKMSFLKKIPRIALIGDPGTVHRYLKKLPANCSLIDDKSFPSGPFPLGKQNSRSARASLAYLQKAVNLLKQNKIHALVTAPVSKEAIDALGYPFYGHTEFLAHHFKVKNFNMMFVTKHLKTVVLTRHVPLKEVSRLITVKLVYDAILLTAQSLKTQFKIARPRIAVCGLNPHAGEHGLMGKEELTTIIPAIRRAKHQGLTISGPLPADTLFIPSHLRNFDAVIAMYHDQGLIPIKTLYFDQVVNLTIGLPFVRTCPAHGTAFDIAGKNKADPSSMAHAISLAHQISPKP